MKKVEELSLSAFRRRLATLGYRVHKHGDLWDLIDIKTNGLVVAGVTREETADWLAKIVFGFSPD